jgi:hypothetical protein
MTGRLRKRIAIAATLAVCLSGAGATSAKALDIGELLKQIAAISNSLSQGIQTFAGVANVPLGSLKLPTTKEAQEAIANTFGTDNPQASVNNLAKNIASMTAASIANEKIWSKEGQEKQKEISDEGMSLDEDSLQARNDSSKEAENAQRKDSSQEVLKSISQQLKHQATISDDQSRLLVIQNTLLQESNLQTSAANGSTASTQETLAGQAKKKDIEEQENLIGNHMSIERYLK